ncbi:hypothetical protein QZH41_008031 [Actinostola sp. cb2023]|nr:hypothetical protein QZH41_008031 [Actinostola sp. cb2023]
MNFSLDEIEALGWKVIKREVGKKVLLSFVNPAGKRFNSSKEVEKVLRDDREDEDISLPMAMTSETADESDSDPEDPEYEPPQKRLNINDEGEQDQSKEITVPMGIFVSTTSSLLQLVGDFNHYFKCPSDNGRCKGKLVVTASDKKGLGGAMNFEFKCCGCWEEGISFKSSELALDSRRGLLYYGHLSMRGADSICDDELWKGTSKAAEGHLAQVLWAKAKEEGTDLHVDA